MWLTARHKADLRRARRGRTVYDTKPDLPGMTKRERRHGYHWWTPRYGYLGCIIRQKPRYDPDVDVEQRELKPRPPTPKRNPRVYHRGRAKDEQREIVQEVWGASLPV